jgi:hypothetical protein
MVDFQNAPQVLPTAPPPSEEVKVRTLKSDLASVATSGGGLPRYQNVKIATAEEKKKSITGLITTVAIIVLFAIVVAIAVYFVNQLVLKK